MKMRRLPYFVIVVALGCSSPPVSYLVSTKATPETAFACALREVNELGYTVTNTNKEAGFIAATKETTPGFNRFLGNAETHDQLTISIYGDSASGRHIRATAGSVKKTTALLGQSTNGQSPSKEGVFAATEVLRTCGEGIVIKQTASAFQGVARVAH
jgi:hypothetical protein